MVFFRRSKPAAVEIIFASAIPFKKPIRIFFAIISSWLI